MDMLFAVMVLLGFGLWFASSLPCSRLNEYWARLCFLAAACIWALPVLLVRG